MPLVNHPDLCLCGWVWNKSSFLVCGWSSKFSFFRLLLPRQQNLEAGCFLSSPARLGISRAHTQKKWSTQRYLEKEEKKKELLVMTRNNGCHFVFFLFILHSFMNWWRHNINAVWNWNGSFGWGRATRGNNNNNNDKVDVHNYFFFFFLWDLFLFVRHTDDMFICLSARSEYPPPFFVCKGLFCCTFQENRPIMRFCIMRF